MMDPGGDQLADLKRWFESSEEANRSAFNKMERDQDYYDGKQLTQEEYDKLKQRGQPPIVINLIRRKIDFLLGLEAQQRSDPKAYPRTPMDADGAEVATDTLRYIGDWNEYSYFRARAWRDLLVTGVGGLQVDVRPSRRRQSPIFAQLGFQQQNPDIVIKRTPWDRMWWDSHSQEPDFTDCEHRGLVIWKDADEVIRQYGDDVKSIVASTVDKSSRTDIYDDKPRYRAWADAQRRRIRVVQCYWRVGDEVNWAEYTEQGILAGGSSPWINTDGDPDDPFIWRSAYVDRDNNRHGIVRDMIDPQDEVNKRRSKMLHLVTLRQVIADLGAVDDVEKAKRQLARPDGFIEKNPGMDFEIIETGDMARGQYELMVHGTQELEKMGPNAALQGNGEQEQSGRAIQARQQGGMVELGQLLDHLRSMDREVFEKCWSRAKQFWRAPQFIRVTDREDAPQFIGLNEPIVQQSPFGMQQVGSRNNIADLEIDLVIEQGPDVAVIEQEVWAELMQVLPMLAQLPPNLQKLTVEAMPYPSSKKKRLLEALEGGGQQPDPMQQKAAQLELAGKEAEVADKAASAQEKRAKAEKTRAETAKTGAEIERTAAETARTVRDVMTPQIPAQAV